MMARITGTGDARPEGVQLTSRIAKPTAMARW
jgi:hypothetical protein